MQVVVKTLSQDADSQIYAVYDDNKVIPKDVHPQETSLLRGVDAKYIVGRMPPRLKKEWRESMPAIIAAEAADRIEAVFPAAMQSTAALEMQANILNHGTDVDQWPAEEQTRIAEIKRGLDFISAMRAATAALTEKSPANPCDDQNWPAPIDPVQV